MWKELNSKINNETQSMGQRLALMLKEDCLMDLVDLAMTAECITLRKLFVASLKTISPSLCVSKLTTNHIDISFLKGNGVKQHVRVFECIDNSYCAVEIDTAETVELDANQYREVRATFVPDLGCTTQKAIYD
ncbi:hypothetical protein JCM19233_114 [Vibrio astriarenae]|nr:hypothetical protein JCM19233_114 [Vibrio sp. C7]